MAKSLVSCFYLTHGGYVLNTGARREYGAYGGYAALCHITLTT